MDLETGVELRRVAKTLEVGPRTRDDGDVPATSAQGLRVAQRDEGGPGVLRRRQAVDDVADVGHGLRR